MIPSIQLPSSAPRASLKFKLLCCAGLVAGCTTSISDGMSGDLKPTAAETRSPGTDGATSGTKGSGGATSGTGGSTPSTGSGGGAFNLTLQANLSPRLRMKSNNEVFQSLKSAFGYEVKDVAILPVETIDPPSGFSNMSSQLQVGESCYLGLQKLARLARDGASTESLLRFCVGANQADVPCATEFIAKYGKQLFLRAPDAFDTASLLNVYTESRKINVHLTALRDVVETMIQMPSFIYRTEFGVSQPVNGVLKLAPLETASALASYFWDGPPDADLIAAADSGSLVDRTQIAAQAIRLFKDPRARTAFGGFLDHWLELGRLASTHKDASLYPEYTPEIAAAMRTETQFYAEAVVFSGDSSLKSLFGGSTTYLNESLSNFYKIGVGKVTGPSFIPVSLPPERRGILSQGSVLALTGGEVSTSPIVRGLFLRRRLLCGALPPPPVGVQAMAEVDGPLKTKREVFNQDRLPACQGCHGLINPLGFGLENFDSVGRYRTIDRGAPIDASGVLTSQRTGETAAFASSSTFFSAVAESSELTSCFVFRMYQFALGRPAGLEDKASLDALARTFSATNYSISGLMGEIAASDAFTTRNASN